VKLIAEPWDVGPGGYQVGNFPVLWAEWTGKYRDTVRAYWKGESGTVAELGYRLTGSSDLYADDGRTPTASVNFITAHDGFTLRDLVSYNEKHNEANGEENRDGERHNLSWNCGVEGETDDPEVRRLRARQQRNLLATLFLSQGVPMLLAGDELGRTQQGNNNAYCQDNELSWIHWDHADPDLLDFTRKVIALRSEHATLQRRHFFQGRRIRGSELEDITWLRPSGGEMRETDWLDPATRCFGMRLGGDAMMEWGERGERLMDDSFLLLFNSGAEDVPFRLPRSTPGTWWELVLNTAVPEAREGSRKVRGGNAVRMPARSVAVYKRIEVTG
jgi:glycogen operon protein